MPKLVKYISKDLTLTYSIFLFNVFSQEALFSFIRPAHCCKGASQVCCLDSRSVFVDLNSGKILDDKFPCLCNIFGFTIAYNWMWTPMCCADWKTIKAATGSPIRGPPAPAPTAPVVAEEAK